MSEFTSNPLRMLIRLFRGREDPAPSAAPIQLAEDVRFIQRRSEDPMELLSRIAAGDTAPPVIRRLGPAARAPVQIVRR